MPADAVARNRRWCALTGQTDASEHDPFARDRVSPYVVFGVASFIALLGGVLGTWSGGIGLLYAPGPVAQPVPDRWHHKATPVTGGLALLVGFLLALGVAALVHEADPRFGYVGVGATAALLVGLCDDQWWIGPRTKFSGQCLVAALAATVIHPHWLPVAAAIPLSTLVLVAAMNSFNLLDNIDGLAAGTAAIAAGTLALSTVFVGGSPIRWLACAVAGACLGFLPLNYRRHRPAALFMGDSGAHFLGFAIGALALLASPSGAGGISATVIAPLLILALPILDTSLVILVRLAEGRPIWKGGRDHLSHRLVYTGLGEREAVAALLTLAASCGGAALVIVAVHDPLATGAAAGAVFAVLVALGSRLALAHTWHTVEAVRELAETRLEPAREHAQVG
jgi:UDP-GlcNAc:undecaprenyl-phosphate/decaprenyl-phosphate GlcNAc-1-phosphate transferase